MCSKSVELDNNVINVYCDTKSDSDLRHIATRQNCFWCLPLFFLFDIVQFGSQ